MKSTRTFVFFFFAAMLCVGMPFASGSSLIAQSAPTKKEAPAKAKDKKKKRDAQAEIFKIWMKGGNKNKTKLTTKKKSADKTSGNTVKLKNPGPNTPAGSTGTPNTTPGNAPLLGSDGRPSFIVSILQFLGVMALMLGGFYYGVRFLKSRSATLGGTGDLVRVIASVPLLQGKFLQIVDMAGKLLVLGVSDHGVNLIAEVEDARTADQIRLWDSRKSASPMPAGLMDQLTRVLKTTEYRFWGKGEKNGPEKPDFHAMLRGSGGVMPDAQVPAAAPAQPEASSMAEQLPGSDANQNMLFQEPSENQAELEKLLSAQKRKLAAIKSRNKAE